MNRALGALLVSATLLAAGSSSADGSHPESPPSWATDLPPNRWTRIAKKPPAHRGILAFSGAALDAERGLYFVFGGGHADYRGNEVLVLNLRTLQWRRAYEPDAPSRYRPDNLDHRKGKLRDSSRPYSRHTYQQILFVPELEGMLVWSGCGPGGKGLGPSRAPTDTWLYKPAENRWHLLTDRAPGTMGGAICEDSTSPVLWAVGGTGGLGRYLFRFDLSTLEWSRRPLRGMRKNTFHNALVCLPDGRLVLVAGSLGLLWMIDPASARAQPVPTPVAIDQKGGAVWHPGIRRVVLVGRKNWALYDPATEAWTPMPTPAPPAGPRGIWGRLKYYPPADALVVVTAKGTWATRIALGDTGTPAR